jgi:hypothetical protein
LHILGGHHSQILGDDILLVDGDAKHGELADQRLQVQREVLHRFPLAE